MQKPDIIFRPLSYDASLDARSLRRIDLVVLHCTELPDLQTAREYGEQLHYPKTPPQSGTGNSGHFYIDRDGRIEQWTSLDRIANHVRGHNERSIGIELVNLGRYPHWLHSQHQVMTEPYPAAQIEQLCSLLAWLSQRLPSLRWIAGHEELDTATVPAIDRPEKTVRRKLDPGPCFPWEEVLTSIKLQKTNPS